MKHGFVGRLVVGLVVGAVLASVVTLLLPMGLDRVSDTFGAVGELLYWMATDVSGAIGAVLATEWVMAGRVRVPLASSAKEA